MIGLRTDQISGKLQTSKVDLAWVLKQVPALHQDDQICVEVRDDARSDGTLQVISVVEKCDGPVGRAKSEKDENRATESPPASPLLALTCNDSSPDPDAETTIGTSTVTTFVVKMGRDDGSALYLVGFGLVLLPWMVRNYLTLRVFSTEGAFGQTLVGRTVRHDRFIFVDPNAPPTDDGRQRARELMQRAADRGSFITPLRREIMRAYDLDELGANRLMRDLAVEAILRRPDYYLLGTAHFLAQLATGWPERPPGSDATGPRFGSRTGSRRETSFGASCCHRNERPDTTTEGAPNGRTVRPGRRPGGPDLDRRRGHALRQRCARPPGRLTRRT